MPINDFEGYTFVAFVDISGFKKMIKNGNANINLGQFYSKGYQILGSQDDDIVDGIFVSDCCILFVNNENSDIDNGLSALLKVIKQLNKRMIKLDIMLTSSINFGRFKYQNRSENNRIVKHEFFGEGYIDAFLEPVRVLSKELAF